MSEINNLFQIIERFDDSNSEALYFKESSVDYQELCLKTKIIAYNLYKDSQIRKGDKVALLLPNCPEFIYSFFAVSLLGGIVIPIGTRARKLELEYILSHSEAKALIVIEKFDGYQFDDCIKNLLGNLPELKKVYVIGESKDGVLSSFQKLEIICNDYELHSQIASDNREIQPGDVALILYTSGTTGSPKGVMLSNQNIVSTLRKINEKVNARNSDSFLLVVPITSSLGCVTTMLRALVSGSSIVLMQQFKAKHVLEIISKKKVTIKVGVPTMFILELIELDKKEEFYDLSSLRQSFISGSECPEEIMNRVEQEMGCQVMIGYGLTETTSYITVTKPDDPPEVRQRTVGSPIPGEEFKVIDKDGIEGKGEIGEILVRGNSVTVGYLKSPERTAEAIDSEGWFHTGDLGKFDEENNLIFLGRKKDLIIRGGFNIYASEIENFLLKHKDISNAAMVGIPDSVLGERSVACIVKKDSSTLSVEEIMNYCKMNLSDYKVPDYMFFFKELPNTQNGKVKKNILKKELLNTIQLR